MELPPFESAYFSFTQDGERTGLRASVTPSLSLEWILYVHGSPRGRMIDLATNILIDSELSAALPYDNVKTVYFEIMGTLNL
jgi:hypothetical protein